MQRHFWLSYLSYDLWQVCPSLFSHQSPLWPVRKVFTFNWPSPCWSAPSVPSWALRWDGTDSVDSFVERPVQVQYRGLETGYRLGYTGGTSDSFNDSCFMLFLSIMVENRSNKNWGFRQAIHLLQNSVCVGLTRPYATSDRALASGRACLRCHGRCMAQFLRLHHITGPSPLPSQPFLMFLEILVQPKNWEIMKQHWPHAQWHCPDATSYHSFWVHKSQLVVASHPLRSFSVQPLLWSSCWSSWLAAVLFSRRLMFLFTARLSKCCNAGRARQWLRRSKSICSVHG